jgi:hypothetical protein
MNWQGRAVTDPDVFAAGDDYNCSIGTWRQGK